MENLMEWIWHGTDRVTRQSSRLKTVVNAFEAPSARKPHILTCQARTNLRSEILVLEDASGQPDSPTQIHMSEEHQPGNPDLWKWYILVATNQVSQGWVGTCFAFSLSYIRRMHHDPAFAFAYAYRESPMWSRVCTHLSLETALTVLVDLSPHLQAFPRNGSRRQRLELLNRAHYDIMKAAGQPISEWDARTRMETINNVVGNFYLGLNLPPTDR